MPLMIDNLKNTAKGALIYGLGNLSTRLIGFILIPLYTSKFTVAEYGVLGILDITMQIFIAVFGLGLYNAFFRWYWDKEFISRQKSIFFTILTTVLFFSIILTSILILLKKQVSTLLFESPDFSYYIVLIVLVACFESFNIVVATLLRLQEKALFYTLLYILKLITSLTLTVYFIIYAGKGIEGIYEALLIGNCVYILVASVFIVRNIQLKFEIISAKGMLAFSLPLLLTALTGIILNVTDRYTLRFLTDYETVGIYTLGYKIANSIRVFVIASVSMALQPMIFKMMNSADNKRFYSKVMTYFTFGLIFVVLGVSLFGKEIIKVLSQKVSYWESFRVVPILSYAMLFTMLRDISLTGLNLTKNTKVTALITISVCILNIGLNILCIKFWGYMGAAFCTLTSQIIFFVLIYWFAQKRYPIPYELRKIVLIIVTSLGLFFIAQLINDMDLLIRLVVKSLLILILPILLYFMKFYEPVELNRLKGFWIKWRNPRRLFRNLKEL
jgi:O-antigen/teichoic acid export membrane protein